MRDSDFGKLLDEVLKERAEIEPRVEMERRILERMRSASREPVRWWMPAGAFAAMVIAAILLMNGSRRPEPVIVNAPRVEHPSRHDATKAAGVKEPEAHAEAARVVRHVVSNKTHPAQVAEERMPKLDTFPAMTQKGSLLSGWQSGGAPTTPSSEAAAQALKALKAEQERPLQMDAIEIKPL